MPAPTQAFDVVHINFNNTGESGELLNNAYTLHVRHTLLLVCHIRNSKKVVTIMADSI